MRFALHFSCVVLLGTATGVAQTPSSVNGIAPAAGPSQNSSQSTVLILPLNTGSCPVMMRAQHLADGSMVKTRDAHPPGVGQWLHLSFASTDSKEIDQARITVHGFSGQPRMAQAQTSRNDSTDATKTLTLAWGPRPGNVVSRDVWLPGLAAVESIDLTYVNYSDGSEWRAGSGAACRIAPDPLMLITSR